MATLLLIHGKRGGGSAFEPSLRKHHHLLTTHTGKDALRLIRENKVDLIVLDSASLRTTGERICTDLRVAVGTLPIVHIQPEGKAARVKTVADTILQLPLNYRKLHNQIKRHLANIREVLCVGGFQLDTQTWLLTAPNGEHRLTPKVGKLLAALMRHPGQVIERSALIQEVWLTDYMGDTRTLDVHIRWIRQAIEPRPSRPRFLQTVRGRGYVFKTDG